MMLQNLPPVPIERGQRFRSWLRRVSCMRISTRLLLIIGICLVPTIGLQVGVSWVEWAERKAQVNDLAMHQVQLLAADMASIGEGMRLLLATAAEFHQVRTVGKECALRLTSIRHNAPSLAFIVLLDAQGQILCASDPDVKATPPDTAWLHNALSVTTFTAGNFGRSAEHPGGFLPYYLPLGATDVGGGGWLVGALDLDWLREHFGQLKQSDSAFLVGAVLSIADADGVVLGRNPAHDRFVGHQLPPGSMPMVRAPHPGLIRIRSVDATERLFAYIPPSPATQNLLIAVGLYEPDLMADVNRAMLRGAILLALVTIVVFALTWLAANRFISRPTSALVAVARRWREGSLSVRAPDDDESSEFGQISAAWNEMAAALQKRQEQLQEHSDLLEARVAERTQDLLLTNNRLQVAIAEREKTAAALLQAQKLQAVGQLAGGIAHDFNNLLATVQGSLDLLGQSLAEEQTKQRVWVQRASGAVLRGAQLTRRLLAFSRRRPLSARSADVNELITDLVAMFGTATLGSRIKVVTGLARDLWPASAEPGQLEAALLNLALNARDAMPEGGVLTLSTSNETVVQEADGLPAGEYVRVTVTDTGVGMDSDLKRRAPEPFFTTKGASGSGLGLSQVKAMIEESGGTMRIRSQPGQGTQVDLRLPRSVAPARLPGSSTIRPKRLRQKVLVVDDDPVVLEVTTDMLRQLDYCVIEAVSGQQALNRLDEVGELPDLVILDYVMPGMNGVALARLLRDRGITCPIVLATGYADLTEAGQLAPGEFHAVLNKPYTFAELEKLLSEIDASRLHGLSVSELEL
jgi:signal transduction histidine kinase/ActR/RegA family two-component response regulator